MLLPWANISSKISVHTIALALVIPSVFLFVTSLTSQSAAADEWGPIELITDDEDNDDFSYNPQVISDKFGNIHVVWDDLSNLDDDGYGFDIFYKKWDKETGNWGGRTLLSTRADNNSALPRIASDSNGNIHVVWRDNNNSAKFPYDSTMKHGLWNINTGKWEIYDFKVNEVIANFRIYDIAPDNKGNIHLVTDGGIREQQLYYMLWDGEDRTWSSPSEILSRFNGAHRPVIAVDGEGDVHIAYDDCVDELGIISDFDIYYAQMDKDTGQWGTPKHLNDDGNAYSNAYFASIAIDKSDNVHVAWYDLNETYAASGKEYEVLYRRYDATKGAWGPILAVSDDPSNTEASAHGLVAVDTSGNAHIIWTDRSELGNAGDEDYDIFYRMWNASTETFDDRIPVTDPDASNYASNAADIATDPEDNLHVVWQDFTPNLGSGPDVDVFYRKWKAELIPLGDIDFGTELEGVGGIANAGTGTNLNRLNGHYEDLRFDVRGLGSENPILRESEDAGKPSRIPIYLDPARILDSPEDSVVFRM